MKPLPLLILLVLGNVVLAEPPPSRLEITEYRLPRVERIESDSVIGYWQPGWMEFEAHVGRPIRDLIGFHAQGGTLSSKDTLLHGVPDGPSIKGRPVAPTSDVHRNIWTREVHREFSSCDLFSLCRNDTVVFQFRDCVGAEDPLFYVRGYDWWIESWAYRDAEDTTKRYTPTRGFQVIVNGEFLSDRYHCSGTFEYRYLDGKPFFLFRRDSLLGWNYAGVETVTDFDEFFHGHCCGEAVSNPLVYADEFAFYARRDEIWYLVHGRIVQ
ncbi:MAG: hypothetical protein PHI18_02355 [bacterium]|nr:hypothetical protein [bacterium]